jgi:hypothetical protein
MKMQGEKKDKVLKETAAVTNKSMKCAWEGGEKRIER